MKLRHVATCTRNLTWETTLPVPVDACLSTALERGGATLSWPLERLLQAKWGDHIVVMIGERAQIRLSYLLPQDERRFAAERVFVWLEKVVQTLTP